MEAVWSFIAILLTNALPCSLLALGVFLTFRLLDFADMTAEGSILIAAAVTVVLINSGVNAFLATLIATLSGAITGATTGVLNRFLKIPKLLSGIITMTACFGIVFIIFGANKEETGFSFLTSITYGENASIFDIIPQIPQSLSITINGDVIHFVYVKEIIIMLIVVALVFGVVYFFFGTEYGMAIRSTGMNEKMARAQGINTTLATIVCVAISNALIALAGSLIIQDAKGQVYVGMQTGRLVIGLASVLIGEAIFGKRSFKNWLVSVALGGVIYYLITGLIITFSANFMNQIKQLLYAVIIVIAICLPAIKKGIAKLWRKIFKKKPKESEAIS